MEELLASALTEAGVRFTAGPKKGTRPGTPMAHLDFHLLDDDIYIEVKQFHSDRIAHQMSLAPNVIAVQGRGAVEWLCNQIRKGAT